MHADSVSCAIEKKPLDDSLLDAAIEEIVARLRAGEQITAEDCAARYPNYGAALAPMLPGLQAMVVFGQANDSVFGAAEFHPQHGPAQKTLGDYRILREVGRGGMGVVYEAEQLSLARRVALKILPFAAVLDPRHLQRFKNEAMAAAHLDHPNIVEVYGIGCERSIHFYAMRFVEGVTLAEVVGSRREGKVGSQKSEVGSEELDATSDLPLPNSEFRIPTLIDTSPVLQAALSTVNDISPKERFRRIAELGIQAAEALDHAHQMGIVHRDVKPSNLMLDERGKLWVTDFGLARNNADASMTMTGDLLGTLRYMSPEQAESRNAILDHRTDIYSLGATLYELATDRPAVQGQERAEILREIAEKDPTPPRKLVPSLPVDLETILLKCLNKEPSARYDSAKALAEDLRRFVHGKPVLAKAPPLISRAQRWMRRHRRLVVVATLLIVFGSACLAVSNVLVSRQRDEAIRQKDRFEHLREKSEAELRDALQLLTALVGPEFENREQTSVAVASRQAGQARLIVDYLHRFLPAERDDIDGRLRSALTHVHLGRIHAALGEQEQAAYHYEQSVHGFESLVGEHPSEVVFRTELGIAESILACHLYRQSPGPVAQQHFQLAEHHYRKALSLDGNETRTLAAWAWQQLNCPVLELRDYDHAARLGGAMIAQASPAHQAAGRTIVGCAHFRRGNFPAAIRELNAAEASHVGRDAFFPLFRHYFLAMAWSASGDKNAAAAHFAHAESLLSRIADIEDDYDIRTEVKRALTSP